MLNKEQVDALKWYIETRGRVAGIRGAILAAEESLDTLRQYLDAGDRKISGQVPEGYYLVDGRLVKVTTGGVYLPIMETVQHEQPHTDVLRPVA